MIGSYFTMLLVTDRDIIYWLLSRRRRSRDYYYIIILGTRRQYGTGSPGVDYYIIILWDMSSITWRRRPVLFYY